MSIFAVTVDKPWEIKRFQKGMIFYFKIVVGLGIYLVNSLITYFS